MTRVDVRLGSVCDAQADRQCWYSRSTAGFLILSLFVLVRALSPLVPPLQSPDEPEHLKRAYLLSKGEIFLRASNGTTGGAIDTGLLAYMGMFDKFPLEYSVKITSADIASSNKASWSGKRTFSDLANTAVYFPLPYLPQALAFRLGESLGATVADSYGLARLFSQLAALGMLWAALLVYPTPTFIVCLFATPMSLFQISSASLDAVTFGMTALCSSLFMRAVCPHRSFTPAMHITFVLCIVALATSRANLIVLAGLPLAVWAMRRSSIHLLSFAVTTLLSVGWTAFAAITVRGMPQAGSGILWSVKFYLAHLHALLKIIIGTVSNWELLNSYWDSYIGVLGNLDTPLDPWAYGAFAALFIALIVRSSILRCISLERCITLTLTSTALIALLGIFAIELLTWTPLGSSFVRGIQGRYFTPILILLGYAHFTSYAARSERTVWILSLYAFAMLSVVSMTPKLLYRFWLS